MPFTEPQFRAAAKWWASNLMNAGSRFGHFRKNLFEALTCAQPEHNSAGMPYIRLETHLEGGSAELEQALRGTKSTAGTGAISLRLERTMFLQDDGVILVRETPAGAFLQLAYESASPVTWRPRNAFDFFNSPRYRRMWHLKVFPVTPGDRLVITRHGNNGGPPVFQPVRVTGSDQVILVSKSDSLPTAQFVALTYADFMGSQPPPGVRKVTLMAQNKIQLLTNGDSIQRALDQGRTDIQTLGPVFMASRAEVPTATEMGPDYRRAEPGDFLVKTSRSPLYPVIVVPREQLENDKVRWFQTSGTGAVLSQKPVIPA